MRNVVIRRRALSFVLLLFVGASGAGQERAAAPDEEDEKLRRILKSVGESVEFNSPNAITLGPLGRFGPSRKLRYERDDFTVRFRRVEFKDPAQTLLLPESTEWVRVLTGASRPRVRITQTFTDYQRFVSDVKIVEDEEPDN